MAKLDSSYLSLPWSQLDFFSSLLYCNLSCQLEPTCETNNVTEVDCDTVKAFSGHLGIILTMKMIWKYDDFDGENYLGR